MPAPTITRPANNETVTTADVGVEWSSVQGATGYTVTVSDIASGERKFDHVSFPDITSALLTGTVLQTGRTYSIEVCAVAAGATDACSKAVEFRYSQKLTAPTIKTPAANQEVAVGDLSLRGPPPRGPVTTS